MIKVGDKIKIIKMNDEPQYEGKIGIVQYIDSMNQLHGTWGGLAIIPEVDEFIILDYQEYLESLHFTESRKLFKSLENKLWSYDEENMEFFDPETNFRYKNDVFKDYIVAQFLWGEDERLLKYLIKNFKEKHSQELLNYMNSQNYLHKYFVSFIGPMQDFYPRDAAQFILMPFSRIHQMHHHHHPQNRWLF